MTLRSIVVVLDAFYCSCSSLTLIRYRTLLKDHQVHVTQIFSTFEFALVSTFGIVFLAQIHPHPTPISWMPRRCALWRAQQSKSFPRPPPLLPYSLQSAPHPKVSKRQPRFRLALLGQRTLCFAFCADVFVLDGDGCPATYNRHLWAVHVRFHNVLASLKLARVRNDLRCSIVPLCSVSNGKSPPELCAVVAGRAAADELIGGKSAHGSWLSRGCMILKKKSSEKVKWTFFFSSFQEG